MRLNLKSIASGLCGVFLAATAGSIATSSAVLAGGLHDHVYADSFGNLIIRSPAGYKRIVVGQGHLAQELAAYTRTGSADVVYLDETDDAYGYERPCRAPGVLLHGRSYMYGLADNVVPVLRHPCR